MLVKAESYKGGVHQVKGQQCHHLWFHGSQVQFQGSVSLGHVRSLKQYNAHLMLSLQRMFTVKLKHRSNIQNQHSFGTNYTISSNHSHLYREKVNANSSNVLHLFCHIICKHKLKLTFVVGTLISVFLNCIVTKHSARERKMMFTSSQLQTWPHSHTNKNWFIMPS